VFHIFRESSLQRKVEAGNDYVVPSVADSTPRNIQHRDDLVAKRFLAIESDDAEHLAALGIPGIVRAGMRLLLGKVDPFIDTTYRYDAGSICPPAIARR